MPTVVNEAMIIAGAYSMASMDVCLGRPLVWQNSYAIRNLSPPSLSSVSIHSMTPPCGSKTQRRKSNAKTVLVQKVKSMTLNCGKEVRQSTCQFATLPKVFFVDADTMNRVTCYSTPPTAGLHPKSSLRRTPPQYDTIGSDGLSALRMALAAMWTQTAS